MKATAADPADFIPVLLASHLAMPTRDRLGRYLQDAASAQKRGYFLPDEDERLREVFGSYLAVRSSLLECVREISGGRFSSKGAGSLQAFMVAFAAACVLVRAADYIVELAAENPIARQKLDEAEPRFGLEAKQFTRIYRF